MMLFAKKITALSLLADIKKSTALYPAWTL